MRTKTETFLRCRATGHVQYGGTGYVFWSPCPCGWNNNQPLSFRDHWEIIEIALPLRQHAALFKQPGAWKDWLAAQLARLAPQPPD